MQNVYAIVPKEKDNTSNIMQISDDDNIIIANCPTEKYALDIVKKLQMAERMLDAINEYLG